MKRSIVLCISVLIFLTHYVYGQTDEPENIFVNDSTWFINYQNVTGIDSLKVSFSVPEVLPDTMKDVYTGVQIFWGDTTVAGGETTFVSVTMDEFLGHEFFYKYASGKFMLRIRYLRNDGVWFDVHKIVFNLELQGEVVVEGQDGCIEHGVDTFLVYLDSLHYQNPPGTDYNVDVKLEEGFEELWEVMDYKPGVKDTVYVVFNGPTGEEGAAISFRMNYRKNETSIERLKRKTDAKMVHVYQTPDLAKIFHYQDSIKVGGEILTDLEGCTDGEDVIHWDSTINEQYKVGNSPAYSARYNFTIDYFRTDSCLEEACWSGPVRDTALVDTAKMKFKFPGIYKIHIKASNVCGVDSLWTEDIKNQTEKRYIKIYQGGKDKIYCPTDSLCLVEASEVVTFIDTAARMGWDNEVTYKLSYVREINGKEDTLEFEADSIVAYRNGEKGSLTEIKGCDSTRLYIHFDEPGVYRVLIERNSFCEPYTYEHTIRVGKKPGLSAQLKKLLVDSLALGEVPETINICGPYLYRLPTLKIDTNSMDIDKLRWVYLNKAEKETLTGGTEIDFDSTGDHLHYVVVSAHNYCGWSETDSVGFFVRTQPNVQLWRDSMQMDDTLCVNRSYLYYLVGDLPERFIYDLKLKGSRGKFNENPFTEYSGYISDGLAGTNPLFKIEYQREGKAYENFVIYNVQYVACKQELKDSVYLVPAPDTVKIDTFFYCSSVEKISGKLLFEQEEPKFDTSEWVLNGTLLRFTGRFPEISLRKDRNDTLSVTTVNHGGCFITRTVIFKPQEAPLFALDPGYLAICADTNVEAEKYKVLLQPNESAEKGLMLTVYQDSVKEAQKLYYTGSLARDLVLKHTTNDTVRLIYRLENTARSEIYENCFLQDTLLLRVYKPVVSVEADTLRLADLTGTVTYRFSQLKDPAKIDTADVVDLSWQVGPGLSGTLTSGSELYDYTYELSETDKEREYLPFVLAGKSRCGKSLTDTLKVFLPQARILAHSDTLCSDMNKYILRASGRTEFKFLKDVQWQLLEKAGKDYGTLSAGEAASGKVIDGEKCWYTPGPDAAEADTVKIRISGCNLFETNCTADKRIADTIFLKVNPKPLSPFDTLRLSVNATEEKDRVLHIKEIHADYGQVRHSAGWHWEEAERGGGTLDCSVSDTTFTLTPPANTGENYSGKVILYMKGLKGCADVRDTVIVAGIVKPVVTLGNKEVCAGEAADLGHRIDGFDHYSERIWEKKTGNGNFSVDYTQYIPKADADTITDDSIRLIVVKKFATYRESPGGMVGEKYRVIDSAQVKMYIKPEISLKDAAGNDWEYDTLCGTQSDFFYKRAWVDFNLDTNLLKVRRVAITDGIAGEFPNFTLEDWSSLNFIVYADLGQCREWETETQDTIKIFRLNHLTGTYQIDGNSLPMGDYRVCPGTTSVELKALPDAPVREVVWRSEGGTLDDATALNTTLTLDEALGYADIQMGLIAPRAECKDTTWLPKKTIRILNDPVWALGPDVLLCEEVTGYTYEGQIPYDPYYMEIDSVVWCKVSGETTIRIDSLPAGLDDLVSQDFEVTDDDRARKGFRIYAELRPKAPCKGRIVYSDTLWVSIPGTASIGKEELTICQGDTLWLGREKTIEQLELKNAGEIRWSVLPGTEGHLATGLDTLFVASDESTTDDRLHLEIGGLGGCNTIEKEIVLKISPAEAPYFSLPAVKCEGREIVFRRRETVETPASIEWKKNGAEPITGETAAYTFDGIGKQEVSLTYTYANGCPARTYRDTVEIDSLPVPAFVSDPAAPGPVGVGKEVVFTNRTPDMEGSTALWRFEGDRTSARTDTCHYSFAQPYDDFYVKLIVTNARHCVDSVSHAYQVFGKPKARIDTVGTPDACTGAIQFTAENSTGENLEYSWDFGCESLATSSDRIPSPLNYPLLYRDSLYRIVLTVENVGGTDRDTAYFRVKSDLKPGFKVLPDKPGCQQSGKVIVDTSWGNGANRHYIINWGDGSPQEETDIFPISGKTHNYVNDGNTVVDYTIRMQILDECHTTATDWLENTVSVYPNKIVPDISITPSAPQCFPVRITITNNTLRRTFTSWTIDGVTFENNEGQFDYVLKEPGIHTIRYVVGDGCNYKDGSLTVEVKGSHTLNYGIQPLLCSGQDFEVYVDPAVKDRFTRVKWHFNGQEAGIADTIYYGKNNEATEVELMMTATEISSGCPDTLRTTLSPILPTPVVKFKMDTLDRCAPGAGKFVIETPREQYKTIQWDFDGGAVQVGNLTQDSVQVDFSEGSYKVVLKLTSFDGCADTALLPVNIAPLPAVQAVAELGQSGTLCYGQPVLFLNKSVHFRKQDRKTYWYFEADQAPVEDNRDSVYYRFPKPGTYQVWIRVEDLCRQSLTELTPLTVVVKGNDQLDFTMEGTYCSRQEMVLEVPEALKSQFSGYEWEFGDANSDRSHQARVTHIYENGSTYAVKLSAQSLGDGCPAAVEKPLTVQVSPETEFSITSSLKDSIVGAGMEIVFKNETPGDVHGFVWSFDHGNMLSETEGVHTHRYEITSGTSFFTEARLAVTNNAGCTMEKVRKLKVVRKPEARRFLQVDTCTGQVDYRSLATGEDLTWTWDFGNGDIRQDEQGTYQYIPAFRDTTYRIRFTVKNIAGEVTVPDTSVTIISQLSAALELDPGYDECMKRQEVRMLRNRSRGDASGYRLDWGDGSPLVLTNFRELSHSYLNTSDTIQRFVVRITLENSCHPKVEQADTFIVYPKATPLIQADTLKACYPLDVHFDNASVGFLPGAKAWWTFEPGLSPVEAEHPTHVFRSPGTYEVTMNVKDACWPDGLSEKVTVHVLGDSLLDFELLDDPLCSRQEVRMRILPHLQGRFGDIRWTFGDQTGALPGADSVSHVYAMPGTYTITLNGKSVSEGNCPVAQPLPKTIVVHKTPIAEIQVQPYGGCSSDTLNFLRVFYPGETEEEGEVVFWDFKNGMNVTGKNQVSGVVFDASGTYPVTLKITSPAGCSEEDTEPVVIKETPRALFEVSDSLFCTQSGSIRIGLTNKTPEAEKSSFEWWYNDTRFSYAPDPSELIPDGDYGKIRIRLRATNTTTLCWNEAVREVVSSPKVTALFQKDRAEVCDETPVTLSDVSVNASRIEWDLGDGSRYDSPSVTHIYEGTGPYILRLKATNEDGCEDVYTDSLTVYPLPKADFNWEFDNSVTGLPDTLDLPDKNNGGVRFENFSTVYPSTWGDSLRYEWTFGDSTGRMVEKSPVHSYSTNGVYEVILRAITEYGCVDTLSDLVSISTVKGLYFPNAFIPAMVHDEGMCRFQPKGVGLVSYQIQVYDRWGVCVWSSDKIDAEGRPAEYWDGTFNGADAPKAHYTWKAHAIFIDGSVWEGNGNLELLR